MLDVSFASLQSNNIRNQINYLNNARNELLSYKRIIESEYHAGEVPALITKINNVISQIDDAKNKIQSLSDSINNTASQIRREQEAEATRQEAARQEAARQEAARQEAARQEAARQEAARQEAARQEATRWNQVNSYSSRLSKANAEYNSAKENYDRINNEIKELEKEKAKLINIFRIPSINSAIEKLKKDLQKAKLILDEKKSILNSLK